MRHSLLLALIALNFAAPCFALDLKGITIGMRQTDLVAKFEGLKCPLPESPKALDDCRYDRADHYQINITELNTIGGELVDSWAFRFADGKLGAVYVIFPHDSFSAVRLAMRGKYGPPRDVSKERFTNRMGALFVGETQRWGVGGEVLSLREYAASSIENSGVIFTAKWFNDRLSSEDEKASKSRAKDL
jgi:hypothetical protein